MLWDVGSEVVVQDESLHGVAVHICDNGVFTLSSLWVVVPLCGEGKAGGMVC